MLAVPENRVAVIKSLTKAETVESIKLLGVGNCTFSQSFRTLTIKLPNTLPTSYTNCLKLKLCS